MMTVSRYEAVYREHGVTLSDREAGVEARILPEYGNRASAVRVHGTNILWFPWDDSAPIAEKPSLNGIPFLAPWGNRLDGGYRVKGAWHSLDGAELHRDANGLPIHGLLYSPVTWQVTRVAGGAESASVTSRFDFAEHPEMMALWPFAHEYEMTYRLADGALEVITTIRNKGTEAMPVAIGFHPYFTLAGVAREEIAVRVPAKSHVDADGRLLATGAFTPNALPEWVRLDEHALDDGFIDLGRGADGLAQFTIAGGGRKIHVEFGPRYTVAIVYAPPGKEFVCVEPMATVTNGINLAAEGKYEGLQSVEAGGEWREAFRIRAEGF